MAIDSTEPFVWGANGAQLTPGKIAAQRKIAEAMMTSGMDYSPIKSAWQGAARVAQSLLGTADSMSADAAEEKGRREAIADALVAFRGGQQDPAAMPAAPAAAPTGSVTIGPVTNASPAPADTTGKIYSNDEPSPLDPPSGADRDLAIRTVAAEAGNQSPIGQQAVASVIRNRAVDGGYGGDTPSGVVKSPNQFEPWNTPDGRARMNAIDPNSPQYKAASDAIDKAYFGDDPTEGATHFVAPKAQAALGRAMPSWAQGEGTTIGDHVFYSPDDAPQAAKPVQVASALPFAPSDATMAAGTPAQRIPGAAQPPAAPSPAVATVAQAMPQTAATGPTTRPGIETIAKAMSNPYLPPSMATALAAQLKPREQYGEEKDAAGNIWSVNKQTGQRTIALKADKPEKETTPTSVLEYNFYKSQLPPGSTPMDYGTWSTAKARAGATNVTTTVGGENKGLDEARKLDAETVRKNQNELAPALEDADHNFQLMQTAIERNGGKLPTGGELGKLGLDVGRTKQYIKDNWGVDLGSDPNTIANLETFNKGGIKAAGDMAKAIGGNRVLKVEFDMAQRANPGLETSDGGNKYLLDVNRNGIAIKRDMLQAQEDYWRANNHSLDGFQKHWNDEIHNNPRVLSNFSVAPPVPNEDGSQFVKLPSTAKGGYSWYRKGQDGVTAVTDPAVTTRLETNAQPLRAAPAANPTKVIGGKTYEKINGDWFEKQ